MNLADSLHLLGGDGLPLGWPLLSSGGVPGATSLEFSWKFLIWATILGGLSAVSLPLGSACGLILKPKPRVTGALAAFGGGALTAALAVELVAPTAMQLALPSGWSIDASHIEANPRAELLAVCGGMLAGGILFFVLDALVNEHGGFLRRATSTIAQISKERAKKAGDTLSLLAQVQVLRAVPPEDVRRLVACVRGKDFLPGDTLFSEGDPGDRLYFVVSGHVRVERAGKFLHDLGPGDVLGEIALLTGGPRTATAAASGNLSTLFLRREDWDHLRREVHGLEEACRGIAAQRLDEQKAQDLAAAAAAADWVEAAKSALQSDVSLPTPAEMRAARGEHGAAPLAIWLGILLDGIPESFVIGAAFLASLVGLAASGTAADELTFTALIPYTLIAGLFLSNFPEAMSSSVSMRGAGFSPGKILFLWVTLMIMTAVGAGVGYWLGESAPHMAVVTVEGLAAGAMLTMILSAMVPEAVHLAGSKIAGLSGLLGFLSAIVFKLME
jgi:zinc transporter ZupT